MKALVVLIILIYSVLFHSSYGNIEAVQHGRSPSQMLMDSIPIHDRAHFVTFHISLALEERSRTDVIFLPVHDLIPPEKLEEFRNIPVPPDFSVNLLDWTELELVPFKNRDQRDDLYRKSHEIEYMQLCFPNGCVDPHDAGQLCCPF